VRQCAWCGFEFEIGPGRSEAGRVTCSPECQRKRENESKAKAQRELRAKGIDHKTMRLLAEYPASHLDDPFSDNERLGLVVIASMLFEGDQSDRAVMARADEVAQVVGGLAL
jgi:hypothetical protein